MNEYCCQMMSLKIYEWLRKFIRYYKIIVHCLTQTCKSLGRIFILKMICKKNKLSLATGTDGNIRFSGDCLCPPRDQKIIYAPVISSAFQIWICKAYLRHFFHSIFPQNDSMLPYTSSSLSLPEWPLSFNCDINMKKVWPSFIMIYLKCAQGLLYVNNDTWFKYCILTFSSKTIFCSFNLVVYNINFVGVSFPKMPTVISVTDNIHSEYLLSKGCNTYCFLFI